ncbi:hypothetical protein ACWGST_03085 [Agromyces sp. NPDC055520]
MIAADIFIGPLLRRAAPDLVVVCLATYRPVGLRFSVRRHGTTDWLAHDDEPLTVQVTPTLTFHFARIRPEQPLPTGAVLAYGIAVEGAGGWDYGPFERIVREDGLAYGDAPLPTFVLPRRRSTLQVLYGSCRKIHDTDGGERDTMADGDALVARTWLKPADRPALLCLGGDQIYADDVHEIVRDEITILAQRLETTPPEQLPDAPGLMPRGRETVLKKKAKFTSDDLDRHVATLCEYLALYGLMWNPRTWYAPHRELDHFTRTLRNARRLLANVPTYMMFDDHDVTDDWNLDLDWMTSVYSASLGRRIVANALMAYWLCQGYGNDPDAFGDDAGVREFADLIEQRGRRAAQADERFWRFDRWEFATPTEPLVYFLDTRTQRGAEDDDRGGMKRGAPAFLKRVASWDATMRRLQACLRSQEPSLPLVLVSPAPVFGFRWVEALQGFLTFFVGAYKYDYENWAANEAHFTEFLHRLAGRNVVVLSGDVHYGFSSTVKYIEFDAGRSRARGARTTPTGGLPATPSSAGASYRPTSTAQFVQLCSSAINNYAGGAWTRIPAWLSRTQPATILTEDGTTVAGRYRDGLFVLIDFDDTDPGHVAQVVRTPQEVRPVSLFRQRINDEHNSGYLGEHNLGHVVLRGTTVEHRFLTEKGARSEHRWDFSNPRYWD